MPLVTPDAYLFDSGESRDEAGLYMLAQSQILLAETWDNWSMQVEESTRTPNAPYLRMEWDSSESMNNVARRVRFLAEYHYGEGCTYTFTMENDTQLVEITPHTGIPIRMPQESTERIGGPAPLTDNMVQAFRVKLLAEVASMQVAYVEESALVESMGATLVDNSVETAVYHCFNVLADETVSADENPRLFAALQAMV